MLREERNMSQLKYSPKNRGDMRVEDKKTMKIRTMNKYSYKDGRPSSDYTHNLLKH